MGHSLDRHRFSFNMVFMMRNGCLSRMQRTTLRRAQGRKGLGFYDSGHSLNEQARLDRFKFLKQHLTLTSLQQGTLENVPDIK
jgi:hypothetical protein